MICNLPPLIMTKILKFLPFLSLLFLFNSCGSLTNKAPLSEQISGTNSDAQKIFQEAKSADQAGKSKKAQKLYSKLAKKHPIYKESPYASYRVGQLLEQEGKVVKSFDAYQKFISTYRESDNYKDAINKQTEFALSASRGELSKKFGFVTSEPTFDQVQKMLNTVIENAPQASSAPKALFALADYAKTKSKEPIALANYLKFTDTYPQHRLAPEAKLRAGKILIGDTKDGNQNRSNLERSKQTFKDLIQEFPNSTQAKDAQNILDSIEYTDAKATYDIAEFYRKKNKVDSAKYYYQEVLNKVSKGTLHDSAQNELSKLQ